MEKFEKTQRDGQVHAEERLSRERVKLIKDEGLKSVAYIEQFLEQLAKKTEGDSVIGADIDNIYYQVGYLKGLMK